MLKFLHTWYVHYGEVLGPSLSFLAFLWVFVYFFSFLGPLLLWAGFMNNFMCLLVNNKIKEDSTAVFYVLVQCAWNVPSCSYSWVYLSYKKCFSYGCVILFFFFFHQFSVYLFILSLMLTADTFLLKLVVLVISNIWIFHSIRSKLYQMK